MFLTVLHGKVTHIHMNLKEFNSCLYVLICVTCRLFIHVACQNEFKSCLYVFKQINSCLTRIRHETRIFKTHKLKTRVVSTISCIKLSSRTMCFGAFWSKRKRKLNFWFLKFRNHSFWFFVVSFFITFHRSFGFWCGSI